MTVCHEKYKIMSLVSWVGWADTGSMMLSHSLLSSSLTNVVPAQKTEFPGVGRRIVRLGRIGLRLLAETIVHRRTPSEYVLRDMARSDAFRKW